MRFTAHQYDQAIEALQQGKQQLEANALPCSICSDSGHMAFECGHNPLVAVQMCCNIVKSAQQLHDDLHQLSGFETAFGVQLGPAKVIMPEEFPGQYWNALEDLKGRECKEPPQYT